MAEPQAFGLLNGQPVSEVLPPPVPCEGCGEDVWTSEEARAYRDGSDEPVTMRGVWVQDLLAALAIGRAWALRPHVCKLNPAVSLVRVRDPDAEDG